MARYRAGRWGGVVLLAGVCGAFGGCSRAPERLFPPEINPSAAGSGAMQQYDADGDGQVAGEELKQAPALKAAIANLDKDQNGGVSADEVADRVRAWQATKIGVTSLPLRVTLDGAPLQGALVVLEPEKYLGQNIKPASGVTDEQGGVFVTIAEADRQDPTITGVHCGLYLVRITKEGADLPAQYNTDTTLGCEVANDALGMESGVVFELKSK